MQSLSDSVIGEKKTVNYDFLADCIIHFCYCFNPLFDTLIKVTGF